VNNASGSRRLARNDIRRLGLRMGGFTAIPLLSSFVPLLLLPALARVSGSTGWAAIGTGQALGTMGAVIVSWGWWLAGPVGYVSSADDRVRHQLFISSVQTRLLVSGAVVPLVFLAACLLSGHTWRLEAGMVAVAFAAAGLTPGWFCIAAGRPGKLAAYEAVPKMLATAAAGLIVITTHNVMAYPVLLVTATLGALAVFVVREIPRTDRHLQPLREIVSTLREQAPIVTSNAFGSAYSSTPMPIASALSPAASAASFSSGERFYRIAQFSIVALANGMQKWVLEADGHAALRRQRAAIWAHVSLGLAGALSIGILGPSLSRLLFGPTVQASYLTTVGFGVAFFFVSAATPFGRNLLIPSGRRARLLLGTSSGAIVGVPMMVAGYFLIGVGGIAVGLALSEALVFFILLQPARVALADIHRGATLVEVDAR
jgi:O-antigen/teichoic acid export membrane protein